MQRSKRLCLVIVGGLLALGFEREPAEEAMVEETADTVPADASISLADVAGTWDMRSIPEAGADTTATVYRIEVTADTWTNYLPDREPIEASATTSGDSIIVDSGPFQSVRRKGQTVTTHSVLRLEGDRLVGTTMAHYETSEADSVLRLRVEGSRAP